MTRYISCALLTLLFSGIIHATESHDVGHIQNSVLQYLNQKYAITEQVKSVNITVDRLDERLKLSQCDESLTHKLLGGIEKTGHITVQTRCDGNQPWSIYIPADVVIMRMMVVAKADLLKGATLNANDFELQPRDASKHSNSATSIDALVGNYLKRSHRKGDTIRLSSVAKPIAVKRGDYVSVIASTGSITVVTKGTAMAQGRVGEQIRVRNNKSERIIKGQITGPGQVEITL